MTVLSWLTLRRIILSLVLSRLLHFDEHLPIGRLPSRTKVRSKIRLVCPHYHLLFLNKPQVVQSNSPFLTSMMVQIGTDVQILKILMEKFISVVNITIIY